MLNKNNQELAWESWVKEGPQPFPNQPLPLNIHYPTDFARKLLVWNCGNIRQSDFAEAATKFYFHFRPSMFIITHTSNLGPEAIDTCKQLPLNGFMSSPNDGPGGGVYVMWRTDRVECHAYHYSDQQFTFVISSPTASQPLHLPSNQV